MGMLLNTKTTNNFLNLCHHKGELPEQWKISVIVPIYKKGDETDCSYYPGISLLSTKNNIFI
jgi:hypothetical protein